MNTPVHIVTQAEEKKKSSGHRSKALLNSYCSESEHRYITHYKVTATSKDFHEHLAVYNDH